MDLFLYLCKGTVVTLELFLLTLLFAIPLGFVVAFGRMSVKRFINWPFEQFILIMRGTPLILQITFVYFAPFYMFGYGDMDRFTAAVIAFTLNYSAYFAEIFRGGIESIAIGQQEAATVLGFSRSQIFIRITLPQVIKRILPAVSNEVTTLIKDTALVQVVGVSELFRAAQNETSRIFSTTPLFVAGVFYFVMIWFVSRLFSRAEKKLSYYR